MICTKCHQALPPGGESCPRCVAASPLAVEGSLAKDLARGTDKAVPLRQIPGQRRPPSWKEEVRERVTRRRRTRARHLQPELPLFVEPETSSGASPGAAVGGLAHEQSDARDAEIPAPESPREVPERTLFQTTEPDAAEAADTLQNPVPEQPLTDLPLNATGTPPQIAPAPIPVVPLAQEPEMSEALEPEWSLDDAGAGAGAGVGIGVGAEIAASSVLGPRPVERPARPSERLQAALVDFGVLGGMAAVVVYFAGRVAGVPPSGLWPVWPYLAAYLALLGLAYAVYFSGTTGQTLGKILLDLRVVDTAGRAPGYPRALVRAAVGALGTVGLGLGLVPLFLDPARRAFHDRLVRTRVVHSAPPTTGR